MDFGRWSTDRISLRWQSFLACLGMALATAGELSAAVSLGTPPDVDATFSISFDTINQVNPTYSFHDVPDVGDLTVSFGVLFAGQTLGNMHNSLGDTSPTGPLTLAWPQGHSVKTMIDLSHPTKGPQLGGVVNGSIYTTPLAILFDSEVNFVSFNLGHLDPNTDTLIEAYDSDGNSLGLFGNLPSGHNQYTLVESTGTNVIGGVSIYVPSEGMDWEGFGISNISFGLDDGDINGGGDPVIPEPGTIVVWSILGTIMGASTWCYRRRSA
jgi:hypothetical protein